MSIQELANGLNISIDRLESIEDGIDFDIYVSDLIMISEKLNVPLSEIMVDSL